MKRAYFLGIDQGTTGITAMLFDETWRPVSRGYRRITRYYPRPGWVEHDCEEVLDSVLAATAQALQAAGISVADLRAVGIAHEGESVAVWDRRTGRPLAPCIVWQDKRTAEICQQVAARWGEEIFRRCGLRTDAYFSASKLAWLLEHVPEVRDAQGRGDLLAGNLDAWLIWKLTEGRSHVTDVSTASRTMLMDLRNGTWDETLLGIWGIPEKILPAIMDSACSLGETGPDVFFGARVPISGLLNDQQAALLGQACVSPGPVKATYGTGCFLLTHTGDRPQISQSGLVTTAAWRTGGRIEYALDGGAYVAGAAIQWLQNNLGVITDASETETLAREAGSNGGVYFVPAFAGLAAPYWDAGARGTIIGISGGTTRAQMVRAALEAMAYQAADLADALAADLGCPLQELRCDGGAAANRFLMQFQADILNCPMDVPEVLETTAFGAAWAAACGAGYQGAWGEIARFRRTARRYEPSMAADQRAELRENWRRAVEHACGWIEYKNR